MAFYALQIWTGSEEKFLSLVRKKMASPVVELFWPRRSLRIRRRGAWRDALAPIFPSYMFLQANGVDAGLFQVIHGTAGFVRFLPSNDNITPMDRKDQDLLGHFLKFGEVVDRSTVVFDEKRRIRVLSGPLKGLEGLIVKVDKRKGRAKVKLEMYEDSFEVDFGFDVLEAMPDTPKVEGGP